MGDQPEPTRISLVGDTINWDEVMLWTTSPASECSLENPEYADFAKRFAASRLAGSMECPAGGVTLEELVLASMKCADPAEQAKIDASQKVAREAKALENNYGYRVTGGRLGYADPDAWGQEITNDALAEVLRKKRRRE